jgi:hypothetical protein
MLSGTCRVHQESQKRRARYCCLHSMATAVLVTFAAFAPTQTGANNSASAAKPTLVASESDHAESDLAIDVNVDYGAQLLLTDSQGRKTGYERQTGQIIGAIPDAVYMDDSISAATDDSSDSAAAESRVLEIRSKASETYTLRVLPRYSSTDTHR